MVLAVVLGMLLVVGEGQEDLDLADHPVIPPHLVLAGQEAFVEAVMWKV